MNKFEQLIEYVINDEEQKARALFHDIVVGKSREIYENLMAEEAEDDLDEAKDEDLDEGMEEVDEAMGGDAADDLIDDVEAEEQDDMSMEAEGDDDGEDMDNDMGGDDMGSEEGLEDRVMDLEDKLDELMAEFEGLMGGDDMGDGMGDGDGFGPDEGGDAIEVDDTEEMMPEMGNYGMMENVSLKAAPKPVTSEEGGVNKKSTVAANAGAKGPIGSTVKPVSTTGAEAHGRPAPTTKDLIGRVGNTPAQGTQKPSAATKPKLGQEGGINNKSIVPGKHN
jgi:hypothetical protein